MASAIAREGYPLLIFSLIGAIILYVPVSTMVHGYWLIIWRTLSVIDFLFALFTAYFFRDPERTVPYDDTALLSPADGTIIDIREVEEPLYLKGKVKRVSIFMSPFNVHINRTNLKCPISGKQNQKQFNFESKGMMAIIGKRDGIAKISGHPLTGISAWFVWKIYYLMMLPTFEKKLKVALDWTVNSFFTRDITLVRKIKRKSINQFSSDGMDGLDQILFRTEESAKIKASKV